MVTATLFKRVRLGNTLALMVTTALPGVCALETLNPSCTARPATLFFILEDHGPQRATGHMVAPEPSLVGRWGPGLRDMW
jgi:hypothetical protein